jgi:hypothetical protein
LRRALFAAMNGKLSQSDQAERSAVLISCCQIQATSAAAASGAIPTFAIAARQPAAIIHP